MPALQIKLLKIIGEGFGEYGAGASVFDAQSNGFD
jgi:hypothetical protein